VKSTFSRERKEGNTVNCVCGGVTCDLQSGGNYALFCWWMCPKSQVLDITMLGDTGVPKYKINNQLCH
jgi:hypothetical protein